MNESALFAVQLTSIVTAMFGIAVVVFTLAKRPKESSGLNTSLRSFGYERESREHRPKKL